VQTRKKELAVRMALGARPENVRALVLVSALRLTIAGVAAGATIAFACARYMEALVFGLTPRDPLTFAVVCSFLIATSVAAGYWPARVATSVAPAVALRAE
jgi:putative ABC transport system permease protein